MRGRTAEHTLLLLQAKDFETVDLADYKVIVDAVFGFSFSGAVRAPFDTVLPRLAVTTTPVLSIDIPSGWSVDGGERVDGAVEPSVLVSLTAPKLCAKQLPAGVAHYLGGRFVPPAIRDKFGLVLPPFEGCSQVVRLSAPS